jgi:hypothetical protein
MALEWALVFQGLSALSAAVGAVKAGFEIKKFRKEEVVALADKAEADASKDSVAAAKAGDELESLDEDMIDTIKGKVKKIKKKWRDAIDASDDQADWARATDDLKSDVCGLLRTIKQVNGGRLPGDWYDLWVKNGCA